MQALVEIIFPLVCKIPTYAVSQLKVIFPQVNIGFECTYYLHYYRYVAAKLGTSSHAQLARGMDSMRAWIGSLSSWWHPEFLI